MKISLEQTAALLKQHNKFVLTAHINPDGDAVGSVLALALTLRSMDKEVICLLDDDIPERFRFLTGIELLGKVNVQSAEQAHLDADLLIILDSSDRERIGAVAKLCTAPILNIDHHISNEGFADYFYLDSQAAATGEIVFALLALLNKEMDLPTAEALYVAIATDCGFFRFSNTTPQTMRICADLLAAGVLPHKISEQMEQRPLETVQALGRALGAVEFFADGRIGCMVLDHTFLTGCDSTEGFIDLVRTIEGMDMAVLIKEIEPNVCRVSMRAKTIDVSRIAVSFGGGGHKKAAGCTIQAAADTAKELIVAQVLRQMED